jgi:hypothetical protein
LSKTRYDIIGDIHGHADELRSLLCHMGYQISYTDNCFCHPDRKTIFLGDFIDRGPQQREVLDLVIPMVENGHALSVMGNHEFNALAFNTLQGADYLRPHSTNNIKQHKAFLDAYDDDPVEKKRIQDFFWTLPLWLDLGELRAVHACWHDGYIDFLNEKLSDARLEKEDLIDASTAGTPMYEAVEAILKGLEHPLPEGISFLDWDGTRRTDLRLKWWLSKSESLAHAGYAPGTDLSHMAHLPAPEKIPGYHEANPPCFNGHYWMLGTPEPLSHNIACLDYSVGKGGKLVAYRWEGESSLTTDNFMSIKGE